MKPDICLGARGGAFIAPENIDWLEAYQNNLNERQVPQLTRQAAE